MSNYNTHARSFIYGLSDFWINYFRDTPTLNALYDSMEICVGQSYLDLLGLLLNSSLQDTPLFSKEYFKFLKINETDLQFHQGITPEANYYEYLLPDDLASVTLLNNRILVPTAALDKDVDFHIDPVSRSLLFKIDPTNAYAERTFGNSNGALRIRSRLTGVDGTNIRIFLNDVGGDISISRVNFDVTISYDGPANTSTSKVVDIVAALNLSFTTSGILLAEIVGLCTGTGTIASNGGLQNLLKVDVNPLDNYALRRIEKLFGAKLTDPGITNWVTLGVEKGDILRILSSPGTSLPVELDICLVRPAALYSATSTPLDTPSIGKVDYAIIREAEGCVSTAEPLPNSGLPLQVGVDGTINGPLRQFNSPTAAFADCYIGDLIEIISPNNMGVYEVADAIDAFNLTLIGPTLTTETPVFWRLISVIDPLNQNTDGVFVNAGDGTATFTSVTALFTSAHINKVLRLVRGGIAEHYTISAVPGVNTLSLKNVAVSAVNGAALAWGLASTLTPSSFLVFSPPTAWPTPESAIVIARRLVDGQIVENGTDFEVNADTGICHSITVWKTSVSNTITYSYKLGIMDNFTPVQTGVDGTITPGSPNIFSSPTAAFTTNHVGYAIRISGSGLPGFANNGIHFISGIVSANSVELSADRVISATPDPGNGALGWGLLRRGTTDNDDPSEYVRELAFWAPNALVDKYSLYHSYGYLINRFEQSSEEYRSLIRGIFQLFMLGPTLERFESAINVVAGLSVIRNDGEILLSYSSDALQSGVDGVLTFATKLFTSPTAVFTTAAVGQYIYISSGINENKLFRINAYLTPTSVRLETSPASEGPVNWELSSTGEHTVTTSEQVYTFPRQVPIRSRITDVNNFGILSLRAFEVMTDVFLVTDYIETPNWWENIQIPIEVMPGQSEQRRQSTPMLFENVLNPADGGQVGDPGFRIGVDSEGLIVPPGTAPKRNKMAFVVLERFLKQHLFSVEFDASLTGLLSTNIIYDLGELVFVAKPTYTYIIITPSLLLKEVIHIDEDDVELFPELGLVDNVLGNANPLMVIGSCWKLGSWFRYLDTTATFAAPTAAIPLPLGAPAAGYAHYPTKFLPDTTAFTSGGVTIEPSRRVEMYRTGGVNASIAVIVGGAEITVPVASFSDRDIFNHVTLLGAANPGNNGTWIIGSVVSPTVVRVWMPAPVNEGGIPWWWVSTSGGLIGRLSTGSTGQTLFEDLAGLSNFTAANIGQWIRLTYSTTNLGKAYQIAEAITPQRVRLADVHQVDPSADFPDVVVSILGDSLTCTPGDLVFSKDMCTIDRDRLNHSTRDVKQYYAVFSGGPNAGERRLCKLWSAPNSVMLSGAALVNDPAAPVHIEMESHYTTVPEVTAYEILRDDIVIAGTAIDLSGTPVQDFDAAVAYTCYGVREPVNPTLSVQDQTLGDTLYTIGMPDPRQLRGRSRTGIDVDLMEWPVEIIRI